MRKVVWEWYCLHCRPRGSRDVDCDKSNAAEPSNAQGLWYQVSKTIQHACRKTGPCDSTATTRNGSLPLYWQFAGHTKTVMQSIQQSSRRPL